MKNKKMSIYEKAKNGWTRVAIGVFICLLAVYGALSNADFAAGIIVAKFMTWCLSFLFGSILAYFAYFVIFLFGIYLVLSTKKIKFSLEISIVGLLVMLLGALILISNAQTVTSDGYLTFENIGQVYRNYLLNSFPDVTTSKNCGIIGLIVVATINSGMTNIGSNIIGSVLLVIGAFFTFAKIFIKFTRNIIDYYKQNFGKKAINQNSNFEAAQDVRYDTTEIRMYSNDSLHNAPSNEPLEEANAKGDLSDYEREKDGKVDSNSYYSEPYINPNPQVYFSNEGLSKATFDPFEDLNRGVQPQKPEPKVEEKPVQEQPAPQERPRLISDYFSIPKKEEVVENGENIKRCYYNRNFIR